MTDKPSSLEENTEDLPSDPAEIKKPLNALDAKLLAMLKHPEKNLEPAGPLAGSVRPNGWFDEEE